MITRSLRHWLFGAASSLALAGPSSIGAQAPSVALTVHSIEPGRLYWVEGGGGNSGVIIGDRGVILVDAKTTPEAGAALIAEVKKLTPKPVTHVLLTHSDGDHVNGLAGMPDGLSIIAHATNKAEQLAVYQFAVVEVGGGRCLPPANRLPNRIVMSDVVATTINGVRLVLRHIGPAHTSGDLIVEVPSDHVAFVGDLITSSVLVHPEKGGTLSGWFATADALLSLNVNKYLGGHAKQIDDKNTLKEKVAEYRSLQAKVDPLVDGGKSLAEVKSAMSDPAKPASGCRGIPYPTLSEVEFNERTNHNHELK